MSSTNSSFVGLQNQGATGYLNSLIQTLFLTPEFRQELFSLTPNEVGLSNIDEKDKLEKDEKEEKKAIKPKRKKIIVELQKLFARLQSPIALTDALSTKSLTNAFGWKDDQVLDQHDINELYNLLLDGIESQMPNNKKILNKYYKGKIINIIKCQICQNESKRYEEFVQLNVILQTMQSSFDTLNDSLLSSFIDNIEELKHENAYFCVNCNKKVFAKKYCRLINLPSIMVCNLNRFYYDLKSEERVKINKKFKFPKSLDLSMFVENEYSEMDSSDIAQYDLIGIVVHRGSGANAGHYHAYIRDMNNEVMWKPIKRNKRQSKYKRRRNRRNKNTSNSNRNNGKSDKDVRKKEQKDQAIAILVSILSENEVMTRNQLHQQFRRANNLSSWNDSSYQSVLRCSFSDFLRDNHRFKIIDADKRTFSVCLANDCHNDNHNNNNNNNSGNESSDDDVDIVQQTPPKKRGRGRPPKNKNKNKNKPKKNKKNKKKDDLDGFVVSDDAIEEEQDEEYSPVMATRKLRSHRNKNKNKKSPVSPLDITSSDSDIEIENGNRNDNKNEMEQKDTDQIMDVNKPHWFDFNDEDITAVFDDEIDDLYDGGDDECPYMVIYRKKCMNTGHWPPQIPTFVESLLIDEPLDAEEDKQEININIIKLSLATKLVRKQRQFVSDSDSDSKSNESDHMLCDNNNNTNSNNNSDEDDIDIQMNDFKINNNNNRPEIVIISSDDAESPTKLICKTPESDRHNYNYNSNENKENMLYNNIRQNKKRKFEHISNETNTENYNATVNNNISDIKQKFGDEPQKKKRKLQGTLANLPDPNKKNMSVSPSETPKKRNKRRNNKKTKNKSDQIKKEFVKSEYLEPIPMTKGNNIGELYIKISEWSGIDINNLQIAKLLKQSGRATRRNNRNNRANNNENKTNPNILNFSSKDKHEKLKRIPIHNLDDILVWNMCHGDLAEKELIRRKQCIKLTVYILSRSLPQSIYITSKQTLTDLYDMIYELLNDTEKNSVGNKGRFRDIDTREIYRYDENNIARERLNKLGIDNGCFLRFECDCAPQIHEIVIRYRLKTATITNANKAPEEELYVSINNDVATLKLLMTSKFSVDANNFDLRKGRVNWTLGKEIEMGNNIQIKDLKFEKTQRLILAENNINKNERKLDIYCQTLTPLIHGVKIFKIPKNCLDLSKNNSNDNTAAAAAASSQSIIDKGMNAINLLKRPIGTRAHNVNNKEENDDFDGDGDIDIIMEEKEDKKEEEKQMIPCDDGLDIYDRNSEILCTLNIDRQANGLDIKKAIINCDKFNLNTKLKSKLSPLHLRISIQLRKGRTKANWHILGPQEKKIGSKKGKVIVEFFDTPRKDNMYGNQASHAALIFVHKRVVNNRNNNNNNQNNNAMYGSRYEIEVSHTQREKLDALKGRIISQCDFPKDTQVDDVILASRNMLNHKWIILTEQEFKSKKKQREAAKKNKKKKMVIYPKPFDRDIIAVLYTKDMNRNVVEDINGEYFETEWDKYYSQKYENELNDKSDMEDEPGLLINFENDSDEPNDDANNNNNNNNSSNTNNNT